MKSRKGKDSRDRILGVALKTFMRRGYQGASLSTIARLARVTKGGIYHYFNSKEELYHEALVSYFSIKDECPWPDSSTINIKELIWKGFLSIQNNKKQIQKMVGSDKDDAILYLYTFLYEATRKYPEFQKSIDDYDKRKIDILTDAFKRAQRENKMRNDLDPELLAFELDNFLQQLQYLSFVNPTVKEKRDMFEKLFTNYWKRLEK
jgi:AcrR family transcriptional regulator